MIKQNRVGLHGLQFKMYKFRTMKNNSHDLREELQDMNQNDKVIFKIENDPRLIRGALPLRNYSLDELPQLFNVLYGDMNFIGPRPSMTSNEELVLKLRKEKGINTIKPGITGWAQVNGRDLNSFEKKVELDYYYYQNKSLLLDIKIIFMTFKVVLLTKLVRH